MTQDEVRALALALPGVTEADHHGRPSFRLGTAVLATVPDESALNVMVDESEARAAEGGPVRLLWWGRRLSGVRIELAEADAGLVAELLEEAWRRRAPARLLRSRPPD
ncbi:hypothetical protein [Geodermatophilus sp. CPCC 206100]|uniref:hypothetical protein n=1 Tax=Geodermatophilus sp. CPCC 206100 TaxID=3020054 RepID=UPI003AFFDD33